MIGDVPLFGMAGHQVERRLDPEDHQLRTYQELEAVCAGTYSPAEIRHYWDTTCVAVEGDNVHNVANDPFMTHTRPRPRPPVVAAEGQQLTNVAEDPFLTHSRPQGQTVRPQAPVQPPPPPPAVPWGDAAMAVLGPGDPDRKQAASTIMVFGPWLLFTWVMLLWLILQHYSTQMCGFLTLLSLVASAGMLAMWNAGKRWGPVSLLALGSLCMLATVGGTAVGRVGWNRYWRQYWWMQTGHRFKDTTASTPAGARVDAAFLDFFESPQSEGVRANNTAVEDLMSAGYKDDHFYCAAPVLSTDTAIGGLIRVNYWAVGIDCCRSVGSFSCEDSRDYRGGYGVVMLDGGFPCPGCNAANFKAAVAKAEAVHGLFSAPGALLIRWVRDPAAAESGVMWQSVLFLILSSMLGFLLFLTLGSLAWYYGVGKRGVVIGSLADARLPLKSPRDS